MPKISKINLRQLFARGLKPTQDTFYNWFDSYWHKDDQIEISAIKSLQTSLDKKLDSGAESTLIQAFDAKVKEVEKIAQKSYLGLAGPDTQPPLVGAFWYKVPEGLVGAFQFLKDSNGNSIVTILNDFDGKEVHIEVKDNIAKKELYLKDKPDAEKILFQRSISINVFNRNNLTPNTYIDYTDGGRKDLDGYNSTDYTLIDGGESYTASVAFQIAFYDESKNYISGIAAPDTFVTPINAKYYRIAVDNVNKQTFTLTQNGRISVLPNYNNGYDNAAVSFRNVVGLDLSGINNIISRKDLFNKQNIYLDTYISYQTGKFERLPDNNIYCTHPIKVNGGRTYEFGNTDNQQFAWYDADGFFISGYAPSVHSNVVTAPINAEYIIFTGNYLKFNLQHFIEVENRTLYDTWAQIDGMYISYSDGNAYKVLGYSCTRFIPVKPGQTYEFGTTENQQVAWYDANKQYISGYAGSSSGYEKRLTAPNGARFTRFTTGSKHLQKQYFIEVPNNDVIKTIKITVVRNSADFCSIRELANSIKDANYFKRYEIFVPNGTWKETDWGGWGQYISIRGQDRYLTIITSDGNDSVNTIPGDYWGYPNSGKKLSEIPHNDKHLIFLRNDIHLSNLTLKSNNSKYVAHIDYSGWINCLFDNCNIEDTGSCNFVAGIGIWENQNIQFKYCKIIRPIGNDSAGIFIHNQKNQNFDSNIKIHGCRFVNCKYLWLEELGSNCSDIVLLENSKADIKELHYGLSIGIAATTAYCLHVIVVNTQVDTYDVVTERNDFFNKNQV